ncbi:MAG: FAD-dependent oxidoreductase, partial [Saprospiraceae bacterium]|nr:FAD-dependent oxidoreductase [Saprospiraceae bacterium]
PEIYYGIPGDNLRGFKIADDDRSYPHQLNDEDRLPDPERLEAARKFLGRRFPGLADAPLQEFRLCQYTNSPDGHLIMDVHPFADNVWLAGAGCGHGFKLGPAIGNRMAEMITAGKMPEKMFSLNRFDLHKGENGHRSQFQSPNTNANQ